VEKVVQGQQSELSDIQANDYIIAVDTFNTTVAPAKVTTRIITSGGWPKVLVFQVRGICPYTFSSLSFVKRLR